VLSSDELKLVPTLAGVTVTKDYFSNTLTANVIQRVPMGIWCFSSSAAVSARNCYWFDNDGVMFGRAGESEGGLFLTVQDHSGRFGGLNLRVLPDRFLGNFISIVNVLRTSGFPVNAIVLNDLSLEQVTASALKGPSIYFSLRFPADNYLPVIKSI